jgi:hypothetical protein
MERSGLPYTPSYMNMVGEAGLEPTTLSLEG